MHAKCFAFLEEATLANRTINLPLDPADIDRLGKLLGMLGSEHAGERAAAGLKANELVRDRGTSWMQITDSLKLAAATECEPRPQPRPMSNPFGFRHDITRPHQRTAMLCLLQNIYLNDWERGFLTSIRAERTITPRQREKLEAIVAKIDTKMKQREPADVGGGHAGY